MGKHVIVIFKFEGVGSDFGGLGRDWEVVWMFGGVRHVRHIIKGLFASCPGFGHTALVHKSQYSAITL